MGRILAKSAHSGGIRPYAARGRAPFATALRGDNQARRYRGALAAAGRSDERGDNQARRYRGALAAAGRSDERGEAGGHSESSSDTPVSAHENGDFGALLSD